MNSARYAKGPSRSRNEAVGLFAFKFGCVCALSLTMICTLARAGSLAYMTQNRSLKELELSMSNYYVDLDRNNALPVQRVEDDIGATVQDLMYASGLIRGRSDSAAFPDDLTQLLCRLNPKTCLRKPGGSLRWVNKKGDVICLPAVAWQNALTLARTKLTPSDDLAAGLERQFGTCSALGGKKCESQIRESATHPDRDGSINVVALAQAALVPQAGAPTDCDAAPTTLASRLIKPDGWDNLPCLRDCSLPQLYKERQQEAIRTRKPNAVTPVAESSSPVSMRHAELALSRRATVAAASDEMSRATADRMRATESLTSARAAHASRARAEPTEAMEMPAPPIPMAESAPQPQPSAEAAAPATATAPAEAAPAPADAPLPPPPSPPIVTAATAPPDPGTATVSAASLENPVLAAVDLRERRKPDANEHTIRVLVFDTDINACHPVLRHATSGHCDANTPLSFFLMLNPTLTDHGSHVSGLIAGDFGVGVHPGALIQAVPLNADSSVTTFGFDQDQQVVAALAGANMQTRVANFSLNLNAQDRVLSNMLAQQFASLRHILFVAAAGDSRGSLSNDCDVLPACLSLGDSANLIVVGGAQQVNGQWQLWPDSASGMRVDLLAPAEDALSAVMKDGWLATMKGTSQSAALVSGLAARLFERIPPPGSEWSPAQVRNRLMATARFSSQLIGLSASGVVDGDRALETERQVLIRRGSGGDEILHGKLLKVVAPAQNTADNGVAFLNPTKAKEETFDFCRLYRASRLGTLNQWVLVYDWPGSNAQGRWIKTEIITGAVMDKTSKMLRFQVDGAPEPTDVPLNEVIDFYDAFSGSDAC